MDEDIGSSAALIGIKASSVPDWSFPDWFFPSTGTSSFTGLIYKYIFLYSESNCEKDKVASATMEDAVASATMEDASMQMPLRLLREVRKYCENSNFELRLLSI